MMCVYTLGWQSRTIVKRKLIFLLGLTLSQTFLNSSSPVPSQSSLEVENSAHADMSE